MKFKRQEAILHIIETQKIRKLEELAAALNDVGISVDPSLLSRDLNELHIKKETLSDGTKAYLALDEKDSDARDRFLKILTSSIQSIESIQNFVVIKTKRKLAQAVDYALKAVDYDDIAGSIAGEDTLMMITRSSDVANSFSEELRMIIKK